MKGSGLYRISCAILVFNEVAEEGHEFRQNIRFSGNYLKPPKSLIQTMDYIEINRSFDTTFGLIFKFI